MYINPLVLQIIFKNVLIWYFKVLLSKCGKLAGYKYILFIFASTLILFCFMYSAFPFKIFYIYVPLAISMIASFHVDGFRPKTGNKKSNCFFSNSEYTLLCDIAPKKYPGISKTVGLSTYILACFCI